MLLVLARHGNTFEAGEKPVWVGARTDLPLTEKGREQAAALGEALKPFASRIRRIAAGPLARTREHAEIAAATAGLSAPVDIDDRLREIDYGDWEGKSSEEIEAAGGAAALAAWNERGVWPISAGWLPCTYAIDARASALAGEAARDATTEDAALFVTSNGVLRYFLKLVPGAFEAAAADGTLKVGTGHVCALWLDGDAWRIVLWNAKPGELASVAH
ncbi:histidine phosphatase family protein [Rhodomicrobium sp. Az07]|uniref:histidine phosphatase family protein n=1 Tax=Rhodomicrobium sp. Az07 TaxID=2839034 RepID=UPI001BE4F5F4|nr:histidine phosphatase family protein [Rhodomicrobium sp. Az07]MBT3069539.1 histidine phosphatase family protein [Rhodomicrobium sp. Az07]